MLFGFGILYEVFQGLPALLHQPLFLIFFVADTIYFGIPLLLEKISPNVYGWLFYYPVFAFSWLPVVYSGFATQSNRDWNHTQHTRGISWQELPVITAHSDQQTRPAGGDCSSGEDRPSQDGQAIDPPSS
jgi:hypothetical protein